MLFVTIVNSPEGKFEETVRALKRLKVPKGIKIREFIGLFGEPDAILIFETENEHTAVDFVCHLSSYVNCKTQMALSIDEFKWTK
ncbi:MAG: hypothetical protein AYK23_01005 [Candidatus Proteinoplasmatales archaeon SG8-5]|nr:MAG: hypothetical protein AYK23_01005 [Candidatus Proteinoplasmatales archaeon SG8-5]